MSISARTSPSLTRNPRLGDWISVERSGRITVRSGKVELGQGALTALAQIVAEELDVDVSRVVMEPANTPASPDEGYTAGSMSVQHSGDALREVCARVRAIYLREAAAELAEPVTALTVVDGEIRASYGGYVSYFSLAEDALLDIVIDETPASASKDVHRYATVGRSLPRVDGPRKIFGRGSFIQDLRFDGQLFGRVVRPPARSATLHDVDAETVRRVPGVMDVVRDGNFLGVVAEREDTALRAADMLRDASRWDETDSLPDQSELVTFLTSAPCETTTVYDTTARGDKGRPAHVLRRRFSRGYVAHASLAPSCGLALWQGDTLQVWSHSQGIYPLQRELARAFSLQEDQVMVTYVENAGCYGHNGADDAAYDAALLARSVPGRHVQVLWSREDELTWEPFGPAAVVEIEAAYDSDFHIVGWSHDAWGNGHLNRPCSPGMPPLLGSAHRALASESVASHDSSLESGGGLARNAVPLYAFPNVKVVTHRLTVMPLRTSALRALGAHINVYAIESVIDELAHSAGIDPVEFRIVRLRDPRARAVLEAVALRSGWAATFDRSGSRGRGIAIARYKNTGAYCAVVAEVQAESDLRVTRLTAAVDVGLVVNPDGVTNQIEGGILQSLSWTTLEQVRFSRRQVKGQSWEDYPILTLDRTPPVDVVIVNRPDCPPLGSGEAAAGPTAAAIGNALADAIGLRVPTLPLTHDNIVAAM